MKRAQDLVKGREVRRVQITPDERAYGCRDPIRHKEGSAAYLHENAARLVQEQRQQDRQPKHGGHLNDPKNKHVFQAVKEVPVLNSPKVVCQAPKDFLGRADADPFADKEAQVNGVEDRRQVKGGKYGQERRQEQQGGFSVLVHGLKRLVKPVFPFGLLGFDLVAVVLSILERLVLPGIQRLFGRGLTAK